MPPRQSDIRFDLVRALIEHAEMAGDPLSSVENLRRAAVELASLLIGEVAVARAMGCSWEELGVALSITRQAAWQRYAGRPLSEAPFGWE